MLDWSVVLPDPARLQAAALATIIPVTVWIGLLCGCWALLVRPQRLAYPHLVHHVEELIAHLILAGFSVLFVLAYFRP